MKKLFNKNVLLTSDQALIILEGGGEMTGVEALKKYICRKCLLLNESVQMENKYFQIM